MVLFNDYNGSQKQFVNAIILIPKFYIYTTKLKNESLSFKMYVAEISRTEKIKRLIALRNNKISQHNKKWKVFIE